MAEPGANEGSGADAHVHKQCPICALATGPASPSVWMVVCADNVPCRIKTIFAPVEPTYKNREAIDYARLERDRNCPNGPHRVVEYIPNPAPPEDFIGLEVRRRCQGCGDPVPPGFRACGGDGSHPSI